MRKSPVSTEQTTKSLCLVVLAAGRSQRFGAEDKLLADCPSRDGKRRPLLEVSLATYSQTDFQQRILIVGPHNETAAAIGRGRGFEIVVNDAAHAGMGRSLAVGVAACPPCDGVMIALGDMPFLRPATIEALARAFAQAPEDAVVAPIFEGKRGHPVVFPAIHLDALRKLDGDAGARSIIAENGATLHLAPVDDAGVLQDIDTRDDIDSLKRRAEL